MFDHDRPAGETQFNWCFAGVIWRFAGGPMMARFLRYLDLLCPHQKKKRCHRLVKLTGSARALDLAAH